jgi:hypothetical protein
LPSAAGRRWKSTPENEIIERLFPDRTRHAEEERRRFALLEAHWHVPLDSVPS